MESPSSNGVRSSPSSSASSSPDQQQNGPLASQQQQQQQHDQLHIVVEPQPDGLTNVIHLINPVTGVVLSSLLAEHGAHIEIQPGFVFRVPYPQVHGYPPYASQQQQQQQYSHSGGGYPSTMMSSPHGGGVPAGVGHPAFVNSACPVHGSTPQHPSHSNGDERLERRREKLQRKLREKQKNQCCCVPLNDPNLMYINPDNSYHQPPPPQPRGPYHKASSGYQGRRPHYHGSRGNTSNQEMSPPTNESSSRNEELEQDSMEEKCEVDAVVVPTIEVVDCSCMKISWSESINNNNHLSSHKFELQMACHSAQFRTIYTGNNDEFTAINLTPATEYSFRLCALVGDKRGRFSDVTVQKTPCSVPERPFPPRVIQKTKTSLLLKWSAPKDGGKPIVSYQLQWNKGDGTNNFDDLYVGNVRQHKLSHSLPAGTPCKFRLCVSNELGSSQPSQLLECYTSASPPEVVDVPELMKSGTTYLTLAWKQPESNGAPITEYRLEMEQSESGYGFLAAYCGDQKQYTCRNLSRNTTYKFRVCACNVQGAGKHSGIATFTTHPETPSRMDKPKLIGKAKTHSLLIGWDHPKDNGGSPICNYIIEMDEGKGGEFKDFYKGPLLEHNAEALSPGRTYRLRASGENAAGRSSWSPIAHITTLPICPGKPDPPRLSTKHKLESTALQLDWDHPCVDGGAPISNYIVRMSTSKTFEDSSEVYCGCQRHCEVRDLRPGSSYLFRLQASNKAGPSPLSEIVCLCTAASAPDQPQPPTAASKSHMQLRLEWQPPPTNGCPVSRYTLEQQKNSHFKTIYEGTAICFDVKKGLHPATDYTFRVQAHSTAGSSPHSELVTYTTSPAPPAIISVVEVVKQWSDSVRLRWKRPDDHGASVLGYNVEITGTTTLSQYIAAVPPTVLDERDDAQEQDNGDNFESTAFESDAEKEDDDGERVDSAPTSTNGAIDQDTFQAEIPGLASDTAYRARVQAVNKIGSGPFSHSVQFVTTELPPDPPVLEFVSASYHSIKLKWGEANGKRQSSGLNFCLQTSDSAGRFADSYVGLGHSFSVGKLKELSTFTFRICATNDAGQGHFSEPLSFSTKAQQPAPVRDLKVRRSDAETVALSWSPVDAGRSCDRIEYIVQESSRNHNKEFVQVYRGAKSTCSLRMPCSDVDMQYRVGAIRCLGSSVPGRPAHESEIKGQLTTALLPRRVIEETVVAGSTTSDDVAAVAEPGTKQLTDSQVALCILGCFLGVCSIIAFLLWIFFS